ncbi:calmodulin-like protein 2 [Beta vulgaris subsp. vulgaris]|uniref:calmodulin-like protein 2 n=1 Tax=Beta vulgaris subsp. vulgaris TaxID=3555 RepID=UPI002037021E|nr:calmodulin-like protein 2 [Beta vulgaris subsp. vulgaris]
MLGIRKLYQLLVSNVVPSLGVVPHSNAPNSNSNYALPIPCKMDVVQAHESRAKALITVFGMDKDGRIAKEKACNVVKQLGLVKEEEEESSFDILEEQLEAKEVLIELEEEEKREKEQLLRQAFMVFDEDGDGFIDAKEIKRVLMCLGLDNGWDMSEIEKMIKVVDLNLDGKVDFHEFELMMG